MMVIMKLAVVVMMAMTSSSVGTLICSDATVRGSSDRLIDGECETFCLIGYTVNSFLGIYGINDPICHALGCATVDENGNFVNDAAERMSISAAGEITVYGCDQDTFFEVPEGLQVGNSSGKPCNYFNPDAYYGDVDLSQQVCVNLNSIGSGQGEASWALANLRLVIGLVVGGIASLLICCCCLWRQSKIKKGQSTNPLDIVKTNPGYTRKNFAGLIYLSGATILLLVILSAMQPFLFLDVFLVDSSDLGTITGQLGLADEVVSLACLLIAGMLSDVFGRRIIVIVGFLMITLSLITMPSAGTIFPNYLLLRLIFAVGGASLASMLTALLSEIVEEGSIGIAAGMMGLSSGTGALIGVFIFAGTIPANFCIERAYYAGSAFAFLSAILCWFLLPEHKRVQDQLSKDEKTISISSLPSHLLESFKLAKGSPRLCVAYLSGLLARGGSILVSAFIALWIARVFDEQNLCEELEELEESSCGEDLVNPDKRSCPSAFTTASRISGITQTSSLIFALLVGYLAYKNRDLPAHYLLAASATFGAVIYSLTPLVSDPQDSIVYVFALGWGIAEVSMIVLAQVAIAREMQRIPHVRGTIAGTFSMIGSCGIIIVTYVGGILFDATIVTAPFVLMGGLSAVVAIACYIVIVYERRNPNQIVIEDSSLTSETSDLSGQSHTNVARLEL